MNNTTKVYWAPVHFNLSLPPKDWNMLYYDPESLLSNLNKNRKIIKKNDVPPKLKVNDPFSTKSLMDPQSSNFFSCPAFTSLSKNVFILENPISTSLIIDENKTIKYRSEDYVKSWIAHPESINNNTLFVYDLQWVFFTEDDSLNMKLTSPYFSNSQHMKYASVVPGQFDIGKWFRNVGLEYNLWNGIREFEVKKGEHLAYVEFQTEKKVELVRFKLNLELKTYLESTSSSSGWEKKIPLKDRYERFRRTRMKDLILKQIKNNIVSNEY
jgi:hypothetical protein